MSGIEVAGLVLGALPLVIQALTVYADGVSTVERYFKYETPLRDLHRAIDAEYVIYQNTCEEMLNGIVGTNQERATLLKKPDGPAWQNPALEKRLKERLSTSYVAYTGTMEDMKDTISEIKMLLKLDKDGKVQFHPSSKFRKEYHRLRFSLKKSEYEGFVTRMQQLNVRLRTLTQQTLALEPVRTRRQTFDFDLLRNYAAAAYNGICAGFNCGCKSTHGINLQLEGMKKPGTSVALPPFHVVFSDSSQTVAQAITPKAVAAVDIRPFQVQTPTSIAASVVSGPTQTPSPSQIKNLCQVIYSNKSTCIGTCVGYLEDEISKQKLNLHQPQNPFATQNTPSLLSLHSVLASNSTGLRRFSAGHRLRLAVLLSTNLLQLYQTPWLVEAWDHNDISFIEGTGGGDDLKAPFISRMPHLGSHTGSGVSVSSSEVILNKPLFALGVLIIELCLGKPFEDLRDRGNAGKGRVSAASDFAVASQLLEDVTAESGDRYADAVRRCIRCAFDTRKIDLDDEQLRRAVYEGVVAPLEENLRDFTGLAV